ncbi:sigma factor-like helix-turn-helix DNA-binding protein [Streptomyces eurythermus]|uniref:sigma factor-like helix-turn-helix DNA-binding protein n=1 Tax=Streptomyces eurythermus TaxID=42237 RepID=UPI0036D24BDF
MGWTAADSNGLETLPPKMRAAVLLAMGRPTEEIGSVVGVSGRTVRRWRERPEVRADIRRVRAKLLSGAVASVQAGGIR